MIKLQTQDSKNVEIKPFEEQISSVQTAIYKLMIATLPLYNPQEIAKNLSEGLTVFSEKLKEALGDGIKGYEEWGKYGWSFSPSISWDLFKNAPASHEYANNVMAEYMTDEEIDSMVYALKVVDADIEELNEALSCYNQGMYKACALLLFGIIENKTYRFGYLNEKKKVKTGLTFAKQHKIEKQYDSFTLQGVLVNITETIKKIYSHGNDFKENMNIINRNYLAHGMSKRNISKLECFQVWCLAYSTLVLLDVIDECDKDEMSPE